MRNLTINQIYSMCGMSASARHSFIYSNVFLSFADDCIKYNHCENGDCTREYIANTIYIKYLHLLDKRADSEGVARDCVNNVVACARWVICLLRKITTSYNFIGAGEYVTTSAVDLRGFIIHTNTKDIVFKDIHRDSATRLERPTINNTRKVDIIDVLKQWEARENHASHKENRERSFYTYTDEEGHTTSEADMLESRFDTPERALLHKCAMIRVNRHIAKIVHNDRAFNHVYEVLTKEGKLDTGDLMTLSRFRDRNNLYYTVSNDDGTTEKKPLTINDLRYLFA